MKEFEEKYDAKLCKKIISEFEELKYQIENEIITPIPLNLKEKRDAAERGEGGFPWECGYCDFREECDKVEKKK